MRDKDFLLSSSLTLTHSYSSPTLPYPLPKIMGRRNYNSSSASAAILLLLVALLVGCVSSFTTTTPSKAAVFRRELVSNPQPWKELIGNSSSMRMPAIDTTKALQMSGGSNPDVDTDGTDAGKYLLFLVMLVNIWAFSIPVEFRRARFCTEEEVRLNPDSHCITFDNWKSGIIDYYANGGGVQFDFTVEEGNKWVGS